MQPTSPLDDALAWLATLTPIERARHLTAVLDARNTRRLAALRAEAIHAATRTATADDVAAQLGVSRSAVYNAVNAHNRNTKA